MTQTTKSEPNVTIVVVPRERFSHAQESLESIYEHTKAPFELVYVDGRSPKRLSRYLQEKADQQGFSFRSSKDRPHWLPGEDLGAADATDRYKLLP